MKTKQTIELSVQDEKGIYDSYLILRTVKNGKNLKLSLVVPDWAIKFLRTKMGVEKEV